MANLDFTMERLVWGLADQGFVVRYDPKTTPKELDLWRPASLPGPEIGHVKGIVCGTGEVTLKTDAPSVLVRWRKQQPRLLIQCMSMLIPGPGWEIYLECRVADAEQAVSVIVDFYLGTGERPAEVRAPLRLPSMMESAMRK